MLQCCNFHCMDGVRIQSECGKILTRNTPNTGKIMQTQGNSYRIQSGKVACFCDRHKRNKNWFHKNTSLVYRITRELSYCNFMFWVLLARISGKNQCLQKPLFRIVLIVHFENISAHCSKMLATGKFVGKNLLMIIIKLTKLKY